MYNGEVPVLKEDKEKLEKLITDVNEILDKYNYSSDYSCHMISAMSRAKNFSKDARIWIGLLQTEEELKIREIRGY